MLRQIAALPHSDQEQLFMAWKECRRRGLSILAAVTSAPVEVEPRAIGDVIKDMLAAKRTAGRATRYLSNLKMVTERFAAGRESTPISMLGLAEVEAFLNANGIHYRSTLRARLSTLFKFAVRRGYVAANPCERLEAVTVAKASPSVMSIAEITKILKWLKKNPRAMAWFALSAFAGLRPEEAEKTAWSEINFKEGWVRIEAQTTKVRQRRVIYPLPVAIKWLKVAKKLKSDLPLATMSKKRDLHAMRDVLGWPVWKKDVTRHTAASYWLAMTGEAAKIATALGHSEKVLRRNYMALVTKVEAAKFQAL